MVHRDSCIQELERHVNHLHETGHEVYHKLIAIEREITSTVEESLQMPEALTHLLCSSDYGRSTVNGCFIEYGLHKGDLKLADVGLAKLKELLWGDARMMGEGSSEHAREKSSSGVK
ncbi:hypothetical protein L2E82_28444 [Cichorium intybus]|uniref:Uncharacterized protein n=1 Tax=Cichorium intybus TaxID=13427 RepID=A0ACB9CVP3_CICIN|nr:hypothetical protein L2E82_28444 [Cichorium intybus]